METCKGKHAWPNTAKAMWDTHREAVKDPECMGMLSDFYSADSFPAVQKPRKASTERAPQGVEQLSGRVSPYNSYNGATIAEELDRDKGNGKKKQASACRAITLTNPNTRKSFEPWTPGPTKPCYRRKSLRGVYTGHQDLPETSILDEDMMKPWDNDTWIPRGGIFLQYDP
ncbi:hypothetical protein PoB_003024200 [Plakobranchus ocellatus]|uniref:Uncharacterized protein n=1 Tax=Plakobranchus ocellatus TaxID=259542 RepID=A0AAV4A9W9_9GAST|nr:hypothetical protein PoB_003024200 [Plakobranchus ocellatus]